VLSEQQLVESLDISNLEESLLDSDRKFCEWLCSN